MNNFLSIPGYQRSKSIPGKLKDLELVPLNESFSKLTTDFLSKDELRPVMSSNYFNLKDKQIAGTNAHILYRLDMNKESEKFEGNYHTIQQLTKSYNYLAKRKTDLPPFNQFINEKHYLQEEGRFPNYNAVIPTENNNIINTIDFQKLYWYCSVLEKSKILPGSIVDQLNMTEKIKYKKEILKPYSSKYIPVVNNTTYQAIFQYKDYVTDKPTFIGFNIKYLSQCLKFGFELDQVYTGSIELSLPSRAMVIKGNKSNFLTLIMPTMINVSAGNLTERGKTIPDELKPGSPVSLNREFIEIDTDFVYNLDTNEIISGGKSYPIDESLGFKSKKAIKEKPKKPTTIETIESLKQAGEKLTKVEVDNTANEVGQIVTLVDFGGLGVNELHKGKDYIVKKIYNAKFGMFQGKKVVDLKDINSDFFIDSYPVVMTKVISGSKKSIYDNKPTKIGDIVKLRPDNKDPQFKNDKYFNWIFKVVKESNLDDKIIINNRLNDISFLVHEDYLYLLEDQNTPPAKKTPPPAKKTPPPAKEEVVYILYRNKDKNFQADKKYFKGVNAYENAVKWGKANFEKWDPDFIHYENIPGSKITPPAPVKIEVVKVKTTPVKKSFLKEDKDDKIRNQKHDHKATKRVKGGRVEVREYDVDPYKRNYPRSKKKVKKKVTTKKAIKPKKELSIMDQIDNFLNENF